MHKHVSFRRDVDEAALLAMLRDAGALGDDAAA